MSVHTLRRVRHRVIDMRGGEHAARQRQRREQQLLIAFDDVAAALPERRQR
jgi:hypothetical protein